MESHYARSTNGQSDPAPAETWYGWDGDRLTTTQTSETRIQTVYLPGSFTPLLRVETATDELLKATRRSLAEVLQQDTGITLPPVLTEKLDILEQEIHRQCVSEETRQWLAGCGLSVEKMARQMDPVYTPVRKIHLYHCDHRGLPQALINEDGSTAWQADHDAWGNVLTETNPHKLSQLIRLPGQQYDEETGLYYNRHRYYDPQQGRYITQDPIGLRGGWNAYGYPLEPMRNVDPVGLSAWDDAKSGTCSEGLCQLFSPFIGPEKFPEPDNAAFSILKKINGVSICSDSEYAGLICKDRNNTFFPTIPNKGSAHESYPFKNSCPANTISVGTYHTHGAESVGYDDESFSPQDLMMTKGLIGYMADPNGSFHKVNLEGIQSEIKKSLPSACRVHSNGDIY